ncbi:MAG: 3-hydroxyacyl-ACP dehydratase FabZ family protein [Planctomycetota bacterium]|jgi:3-hydroxymyristoyl/3-hydroxydecanoyl-(acyl carrier protein) dehydratase
MKFRFVDRVLAWRPRESIRGVKTVSFEEYRLRAPFGGPDRLPESLLLESFFQLGNWLIMLSSDFRRMGLVVRTQQVTFGTPPGPGESMVMDVSVRRYRDDGVLFDGSGRCGGRLIASGTGCLATPVPLADYADPDDVRTLFGEIFRPDAEAAP